MNMFATQGGVVELWVTRGLVLFVLALRLLGRARVDILVNGGFSPEAFGIGAAGVLGSFVTGLLIGWVASLLRKAK